MMPNRPVTVRLWVAMTVTALAAGAGWSLADRYLSDDTAAAVEASTENQNGLICVVGKLADGLVSIVDDGDRPPEVDELDDLLDRLHVELACDHFIESRRPPP